MLLTYIGMLCQGKTQYEAVREMMDDPDYYKYALGISYAIPSAETLRQRFDMIGDSLRKDIQQANVDMLREMHIEPTALDSGNDASENIGIFMEESYKYNNVSFIIKRNPRQESKEEWLGSVRECCQTKQSLIFTMPTEKVSSITVKSRRTWMLKDSRRESLRATNWCWS